MESASDKELNRTSDDEARRGERARLLMQDPIFKEACQALDDQLTQLRSIVPIQDVDMHTRLILMEQLKTQFVSYFTGVMQSGEMARQELKLRESAIRQYGNALRRGIRNIGV